MLKRTQRDEVLRWFRDEKLSAAAALERAEGLGYDLKRAAAYNLRLQALGEDGDRPSDQMRRHIERTELAGEPAAEPAATAALTPEDLEVLAKGPIEQLMHMRRRLVQLGAATEDPKVAVAVANCLCSLASRINELQDRASTAERPRSLLFLPIRRPDPARYDPADPGSWPDNPYLLYPYRPYSCVCWGSQIWEPAPPAQLQDGPVPLELRREVVDWLRTLAKGDLDRAPREVLAALESAP